MKLLLIEDDLESAKYLAKGLREHGHVVDHRASGKDGLFMATTEHYDALIVDRMVPEVDGMTVVQTLRASGNETPILFLTALDKVEEKVKGLKAGADDYLAKPYSFTELMARLETITRRKSGEKAVTKLVCGELEMDLLTRTVRRAGKEIDLQAREFSLLWHDVLAPRPHRQHLHVPPRAGVCRAVQPVGRAAVCVHLYVCHALHRYAGERFDPAAIFLPTQ